MHVVDTTGSEWPGASLEEIAGEGKPGCGRTPCGCFPLFPSGGSGDRERASPGTERKGARDIWAVEGEALPDPEERAGVLLGAVKAALVAPTDAPEPKGFPNPPRAVRKPVYRPSSGSPGRQATGRKPAGGWNATIPSGHPPGMGRESPSERRRGCGNMALLQHRGLRTRRRCRSPTPPKGGSGTASGAGRAAATSMPPPGCGT